MKFLFLSLLLLCAACDIRNTEGDNPTYTEGQGTAFWSDYLASEICKLRNPCVTPVDPMCMDTLLKNTEITNELRMNPPYRTLAELSEGERVDAVVINAEAYPKCLNAMKALSCTSFTDYAQIHQALRADIACTTAFKVKN